MQRRNSSDPNTEPCGTTLNNGLGVERASPDLTWKILSARNTSIQQIRCSCTRFYLNQHARSQKKQRSDESIETVRNSSSVNDELTFEIVANLPGFMKKADVSPIGTGRTARKS